MVPVNAHPLLIPFRKAVLLVFMPSKETDRRQHQIVSTLADALQGQLDESVRVLKIDEAAHGEVIRSFDITSRPAFVLVQRGVELWRHEGLTAEPTLTAVSCQLLTA